MRFPMTIILFLLIFTHPFLLYAQSNNVAKIGNVTISDEEFKYRYELSPMALPKEFINEDSLKYVFLYSLIAEKLWAMEAIDKGFNTSERFEFYFNPIKKAIIRDKLFELEIKDKVTVSAEDINNGIKNYFKIPKVEVLSFFDSAKAFHSYERLVKLGSIDSLVKTDTSLKANASTFDIEFTTFKDEAIENMIFNLAPKQFTKPIENDNAWFIFQIDSIKTNLPSDSQEKSLKDVEELIRNRRIKNLYNKYYAEVFNGYSIRADEKLFTTLANTVFNILKSDTEREPSQSDSSKIYLTESDYDRIKQTLGKEILNSRFFTTKFGEVTLNDFLSDLTMLTISFPDLSRNSVNKVLSNKLKTVMQQESFYQLGVKKGLENSANVLSQLIPWKDNLLAQIIKNTFNSKVTVSEDEMQKYYASIINDSSAITNYKYLMISSGDLETIERIFNMLAVDQDLENIENYYKNSASVSIITTDELSNPIIDKIKSQFYSSDLRKNNWYGPIRLSNTYGLVKILDVQEVNDTTKNNFAAIKDRIRSRLYFKKLDGLLESETVKLANKFGVTVYKSELNDLQLSNIEMFVVRYLGFGGRIAALPVTTPFYKWYYMWKSDQKINP